MAMVLIRLRDSDDGQSVDIRLESDPPIQTESPTSAQIAAIEMLDAVATPDDLKPPE